ncbi:MAG: T9SS type A sorting domain-containing protein [Bacteroidia bacterium]|nr:T9SS type A sorting domain-containing protein [Bacteroidia bacterium]
MKKLLLLTTICFCIFFSRAQVPDYFANDPKWRIDALSGNLMTCLKHDNYMYYVMGDSIVNSTTYKKIYRRGNYYETGTCSNSFSYDIIHSLLRQDSLEIWKYDPTGDMLLFDFDLQIGDSVPVTSATADNGGLPYIVSAIDTFLVGTSYRKKFDCGNGMILLEGIGHQRGLIDDWNFHMDWNGDLVCFSLTDTVYYPSLNAPCDLTLNSNSIIKSEGIKFYPNPASEKLTVDLNSAEEIISIEAFDVLGKKFFLPFEIQNNTHYLVELKKLATGVYFLKLNIKTSTINVRIVKE